MTLWSSLRTEGSHHVPRSGPVIVVSNHQSVLDPLLIGIAARRQLWHLARHTLFTPPWFAALMRSFNAVPVDQEGTGIQGLRQMLQLLREERAVTLFPEGERTHDGSMQPLKPGVQLLMKRTSAPIVPVGIAGAFDAWPRNQILPRLAPLFLPSRKATLAVSVGKPIPANRFAELDREKSLEKLFDVIAETQKRAERLRRR